MDDNHPQGRREPRGTAGPAEITRRRVLGLAASVGAAVFLGPQLTARERPRPDSEGSEAVRRLRRWAMVIDLRACDGCVSLGKPPQCTQACILQRQVPEGMEWIQVYRHELPGGGSQFVPTPCMQCQNAPCVNVCPVGATFATPEGTILIDQERCIGCRLCMAACPYQRRFFNWAEPVVPEASLFADYDVESQIPARRGTVMKCDFCAERPRQGNLPYCIDACPNGALYYGDEEEDVASNGRTVVKLSRFLSESNAFRLKEELGTKPNVYYVEGHGEAVGRAADDPRQPLPVEWPWASKARAREEVSSDVG